MKVWLVGRAGYDTHVIKYVCLSEETALKRWNDVRNELIVMLEEQITYSNEEWEGQGVPVLKYEIEVLRNMKIGDDVIAYYDHPILYEMEAEP